MFKFALRRRWTRALCAMGVAAMLPASPRSAAAQHTQPNPALDVQHYDFSLVLPDTGHSFDGLATIRVMRRAPADTLALDLVGLTVSSVEVNSRTVIPVRTGDQLLVPLPHPGVDQLDVMIRYGGVPDDGLIIRQDTAGRWTYFGDNWPNRARHWLPTVDHPSDKATVSWSVSAPASETVVANGVMTSQHSAPPLTPNGAPRRITEWRESKPIATYLMVIAAAPLTETSLGETACGYGSVSRCVPQMVYTAPEQAPNMPGPFSAADSIVTFFSRLIAPFPFEKLAHLQSSTRFGGMENATAIFYSDRAFRTRTMNDGLISHETAHQWFGDAVTEADWPELWLSEGFATYFSALWTQHAHGDSAFRQTMQGIRAQVLRNARVARLPVIDTVETNLLALLDANSYQKGGFVLHMLRSQLGDSAFFRGLRIYFHAHEYGNATSDDLQHALEKSSGRPLQQFFDQWLRRPGFPRLSVHWAYDASAHQVHVTVDQTQGAPYYSAPLVLEFTDTSGQTARLTVTVKAEATTQISAPLQLRGAPASVVADPDVELLAAITVAPAR